MATADGRKVDTGGVLGVTMKSATLDPRGAYLLPSLLDELRRQGCAAEPQGEGR